MEREACVCDHGYERSDLCAEIIIIIIIIITVQHLFGTTVLSVLDGLESERILKVTVLLYTTQGLSNRLLYFGFLEKAVRRKPAPSTKREPETGTSNRTLLLVGVGNGVSLDTFALLYPEKAKQLCCLRCGVIILQQSVMRLCFIKPSSRVSVTVSYSSLLVVYSAWRGVVGRQHFPFFTFFCFDRGYRQ